MTHASVLEQQLAALATGLCLDAGIRLAVAGESWSYDAWRRILTVAETDLSRHGGDWCAGRLVNEVGHYWLTRHDLFRVALSSAPIARVVMDALDDDRVDRWMVSRYPGAAAWLSRVHETVDGPPAEPLPLVISFARQCGLEPGRGHRPAPYPLHPLVVAALDETRVARRAYGGIAPSTQVGQVDAAEARRRYVEDVVPRLIRPLWLPAPFEAETRLRALEALQLAEAEILPVAERLLQLDCDGAARWLAEHPDQARAAADGQPCEGLPWGDPAEGDGHPQGDLAELARDLLERFGEAQGEERLCQRSGPPRPMPPGRGRRVGIGGNGPLDLPPPRPTDYRKALARMAPQIDQLVDQLQRVLRPRQRLGQRSGYPSGRSVDLRRLMSFEADPRQYNKLWVRSTIPERRRVAFSLLVDLSGSMSGNKADVAMLGTVLLAETLHRLEVPFAINGFQADVIPFADFFDPFDEKMRTTIASLPSQIAGCNDDGPCLLKVSEALLDQAVEERFMLVVSDGQPSETSTSEQDLRDAIATLTASEVPLHLFGIGLGPDTQHVTGYYPECVASVPTGRFADEIGQLIARGLGVA